MLQSHLKYNAGVVFCGWDGGYQGCCDEEGGGFWEDSPHRLSDKHNKFNGYYFLLKEFSEEKKMCAC